MITFRETVETHLECLNHVLERLIASNCDERSITVIKGMIEGTLSVLEGLDA